MNLTQADGCFGSCRVVELNLQVASARPVHANSANRRECLDASISLAIYNYSGHLFPFHSFSLDSVRVQDLFYILYSPHNAGRSQPQRRHRMVRLPVTSSILILNPRDRNDILRKHGVIPEKPQDPEPLIQEALVEAERKAYENRLEDKDLDELAELEDEEDDEFLEQYRCVRI